MKRYVCYIGTKGMADTVADAHFIKSKEDITDQWKSFLDKSILIFIRDPNRSGTEIFGLPY